MPPRLIIALVVLFGAYVAGVLPVLIVVAIPALMIRGWWCSSHDMARIGRPHK